MGRAAPLPEEATGMQEVSRFMLPGEVYVYETRKAPSTLDYARPSWGGGLRINMQATPTQNLDRISPAQANTGLLIILTVDYRHPIFLAGTLLPNPPSALLSRSSAPWI